MQIKFLGTGAAEGVPSMFCKCAYCENIRKLGASEFRSRTQVLIDGVLSVDFPPEAYSNSLKYGHNLADLKYLLVTHSHMDHFYAHDFILRGYKYAQIPDSKLEIFGNAEVNAVFAECTAREMKPEVAPNLQMTVIKPYEVFTVGEYKVITLPAQHSKTEGALLFYIERGGKGYLHFHDTGRVCDEAFEFLAQNGAKPSFVAFDCDYVDWKTGGEVSRHMGIVDDMLMKKKMLDYGIIDENAKCVITHFSHNGNPTREHLKEIEDKYGVIAAYDGMTVDL